MLAAYVSGLNDCAFCHGTHVATAKRFGVDPSLLDALLQDVREAQITDNLKHFFTFAQAYQSDPDAAIAWYEAEIDRVDAGILHPH